MLWMGYVCLKFTFGIYKCADAIDTHSRKQTKFYQTDTQHYPQTAVSIVRSCSRAFSPISQQWISVFQFGNHSRLDCILFCACVRNESAEKFLFFFLWKIVKLGEWENIERENINSAREYYVKCDEDEFRAIDQFTFFIINKLIKMNS